MNAEIDKRTLFNFFEGKATLMQRVLIEKWLEEAANRELYFQWTEEWENANLQLTPDAEMAYQKSLVRINVALERNIDPTDSVANAEVLPLASARRPFRYWWAASVIILVASLIGGWQQRNRILTREYRTNYGEIKTLVLPDGSSVVMNANSILQISRFGFGWGTREVKLSGEAKFSVIHTKSHQKFIVRTPDQWEVEVLGTEFVVFSRERGSKVVLNTGKVQLRIPEKGLNKPLSIQPGDVVTMNRAGKLQLKHHQSVQPHQAWEEKRFIFQNTSLREITAILRENYGITLLVPDASVANRTFGGTFKVNKPESLLRSLAEMLDLQLIPLNVSTYQLREYHQLQP